MLPLHHLDFTLTATRPIHWPHYAGSALRGAFGRALRHLSCVTRQAHCTGCALRQGCAYGVVFDPAAPAQPLHPSFQSGIARFVLHLPPLKARDLAVGEPVQAGITLLGASGMQGSIEAALERAFGLEWGKGADKGALRLELGDWRSHSLSPFDFSACFAKAPLEKENAEANTVLSLRFLTPWRALRQGQAVRESQAVDWPLLLAALHRRALQAQQLGLLPASPALPHLNQLQADLAGVTLDAQGLKWHRLTRHSHAQGQSHEQDGWMGTLLLRVSIQSQAPVHTLLHLGEQLHIGKGSAFGLGRYELEPLPIKPQ